MTISTTKETILLWASNVLPSLFPFFVISKCILYNDGILYFSKFLKPITKFLNLPDSIAFPLSMSLLCGYQTGSKTVASLNIKNNDIFANICFSASPIFVIGTVGTALLNNVSSGYILYTIHICSLIIFSVFYTSSENTSTEIASYKKGSLFDAISESTLSILSVCGYMVIYNLFAKIFLYFLPEKTGMLFSGIMEFTTGIKNSIVIFSDPIPIISFFLSFGGFCVISQCLSTLKNTNRIKFIFNRFLSGIISFFLCLLYKKTAIYVPIIITLLIVISVHFIRRKNFYWLKSARS